MTFDREAWMPLATRIYDDNVYTWEFGRREDGTRIQLSERPESVQNGYLERAQEYVALVPNDELETMREQRDEWRRGAADFSIENREMLGQLARVRELLRDLPSAARVQIEQALDGPPRCESRSGGDTDARCAYPVGHGRIRHRGQYVSSLGDYAHANEGAGIWWNER